MVVDVRLLAVGMSMQSGTITEWLKQVGDQVDEGEVLAEAEEAKSNFEIVCPCRGVVSEILVELGVEVPVQTILVRIDAEGD